MRSLFSTTLLVLLLAFTASAGPILIPDGVPVSLSDPGLGRMIFAVPGSTWEAWFNDNWGNSTPGVNGDFDFNDLVTRITFGLDGSARVIGVSAADTNVVNIGGMTLSRFDVGPKTFAYIANTELIISAMDTTTGLGPYFSGPAIRNPDGNIHWWTQQIVEIPEPMSFLLMGIGLVALGFMKQRRTFTRR